MKLKLKTRTKLPAALVGRTGIAVVKNGLTYNLDLDYSGLVQTSQFDAVNDLFAVWNKQTGVWNTINPAGLVAGSFQSVNAASATVADGTSLLAIQRTSPSTTALTLPLLANQGGKAIVVLDWSTSVTSHAITITPSGGATIMKAANWTINSSASQAVSVVLYPSLDLNAWHVSPLSTFLQSGTGAISRSFQDKERDVVSVTDFGAKGDGVNVTATVSITSGAAALTATGAAFTAADVGKTIVVPGAGAAGAELITTIATFTDAAHVGLTANAATTLSAVSKSIFYGTDNTTAINNALAAGTAVFVPAGNFGFSGTLQILKAGNYLIGTGTNSSILTSTSKSAPAVQSGGGVQDWGVKHLTVTRVPVATSGAIGVYQPATNDAGFIDGVTVSKHHIGVSLSSTGYSRLTHSNVQSNVSHGVQFISDTGAAASVYQWNLDDVVSGQNGGDGFRIDNTTAAAGATMGDWVHVSAFSNGGAALNALGASGKPINGIRINGAFFGQDLGAAEVFLDTYNSVSVPHYFANCQVELGAGTGFTITSNNGSVSILNPWVQQNAGPGISTLAAHTTITGGYILSNGTGGASPGVTISAGRLHMTGCTSSNAAGSSTQNFGVFLNTAGPHVVQANDLNYGIGNSNSAISVAVAPAAGSKIINNTGATEFVSSAIASGSAVSLTSNTPANVTSISLLAGDWDVVFEPVFTGGVSTVVTNIFASVSTTSATSNTTVGNYSGNASLGANVYSNSVAGVTLPVGPVRLSLTATTTVYGVVQSLFSTSTTSAYGYLRAQKVN